MSNEKYVAISERADDIRTAMLTFEDFCDEKRPVEPKLRDTIVQYLTEYHMLLKGKLADG